MEQIATSAAPTTPAAPNTPDNSSTFVSTGKEFTPLLKHWNLESDPRTDSALGKIWEWAKEKAPSKDKDSVIFEVIKLSHKLGSANVGEMPYAKLENYVTVYRQFPEAENRLKELDLEK